MSIAYSDPRAGSRREAARITGGHKCDCCGSREYVRTASGAICSYCRTPERTASAPVADASDDHAHQEWSDFKWGTLAALAYNLNVSVTVK